LSSKEWFEIGSVEHDEATRIEIAKQRLDSVITMFAEATDDLCSDDPEQCTPKVANVSQQEFEKCWHDASDAWLELKLAITKKQREARAVKEIEQAVSYER
tara:strand:- start:1363 stop:1665 length:303 start_codon:yes stop_codon:yes gene_type:complete